VGFIQVRQSWSFAFVSFEPVLPGDRSRFDIRGPLATFLDRLVEDLVDLALFFLAGIGQVLLHRSGPTTRASGMENEP
jgi:hypothetical protein